MLTNYTASLDEAFVCIFKEENDGKKQEENPTQEENTEVKKSDHGTKDVQQMEGIKDTAGTTDDTEKEVTFFLIK